MRVDRIGQDLIVEERAWRGGVEMVSHVNHSHVARIRTALGLSVSWGRPFGESRAGSQVLPLRSRRRRLGATVSRPNEPKADHPADQLARRRISGS